MGYLNKATITVDAILTNRGRQLLAEGGQGLLQITKFAVADDEVDYGLYNTGNVEGTEYFGNIIENMPVLEATPDETQIMRYKLVSITGEDLTRFGSAVIPQIQIQGTSIPANKIISLFHSATAGHTTITLRPTTTFTSNVSEAESSYTLLLADSSLATVEVRTPATGLVPANNRGSIAANGLEFTITALNKTGSTPVSIFGGTSGAVYTFTLSITAST
jgi:hypothetical protein